METQTRKILGQPRLNAGIAERCVPAAFAPMMGDIAENYVSLRQYIQVVVRAAWPLAARRVRRTFDAECAIGQACVLLIAFNGAPLLPLAAMIAGVVGVLILRDAYLHPSRRSHRDAVLHAIVASTLIFASQVVFGFIAPSHLLSYGLLIQGAAVSSMLMPAWRFAFCLPPPPGCDPRASWSYNNMLGIRWFTNDPSAALVDWEQVWFNLGAWIPLTVCWIYVKKLNRNTARQLQDEIDARRREAKS